MHTTVVVQVMLFGWKVLPKLGDGPFWLTDPDAYVGNCNQYWLQSLTLVGNLVGAESSLEMCMGHSWWVPSPLFKTSAGKLVTRGGKACWACAWVAIVCGFMGNKL